MAAMIKPIDIVIVSYERFDFTRKTLEYIHERTRTPFRIILVDNNSQGDIQEWLVEQYYLGRIHNLTLLEKNFGIHAAKNVALAQVQSQIYVDTDNDILVPEVEPDWLYQMARLLKEHPEFGSIAMRPQILVGRDESVDFAGNEPVAEFNHTGAHMRIMRTGPVKEAGGWKPTWDSKRNDEDKWIAEQLKKQGYKSGYTKYLRCWHLFGENWGYGDMDIEEHGHREVWPPVETFDKIKVDPKTFQPLDE